MDIHDNGGQGRPYCIMISPVVMCLELEISFNRNGPRRNWLLDGKRGAWIPPSECNHPCLFFNLSL